jgi:hypothetical protein
VTADGIADRPRDVVIRVAYEGAGRAEKARHVEPDVAAGERAAWSNYAMSDPDPPKLAELITCRWCASVWLAAGVVAMRRMAPRAWHPMSTVLAFSAAAALLARLEDD